MASPARAITFVTNRAELNANDLAIWSSVGSVVGPISDVSDPSVFLPDSLAVESQAGLSIGINIPPTSEPGVLPPFVFETSSGEFIETNFADGDFILFTGLQLGPPPAVGNPGPITLTFSEPVFGVGTQLAAGGTISSYLATVNAFDRQDQLLGSFSTAGTSSLALDNSAVFLGVVDEQPTISKLEFSTEIATAPFGINQLSLATNNSTPVPEPSLLIAMSMLALWGYRYSYQTED
ncbi:MAG: hypothetical protein AAGI69_13685 [Cyanobacteria bacterium P01_H01_bin.21]